MSNTAAYWLAVQRAEYQRVQGATPAPSCLPRPVARNKHCVIHVHLFPWRWVQFRRNVVLVLLSCVVCRVPCPLCRLQGFPSFFPYLIIVSAGGHRAAAVGRLRRTPLIENDEPVSLASSSCVCFVHTSGPV